MKAMTKALYGWFLAAIFLEIAGHGQEPPSTLFRMGIAIAILIIEDDS